MPGYGVPKPDGQRRRRNPTVPMTQLPAGGRKGPPPKWPLEDAGERELHWWKVLWAEQPQAAAWDRFNLKTTVARYCRVLARYDRGSMSAATLTECRHLEDRLGLNPLSMLRLRWDVAADEVAERRAERVVRDRPDAVDAATAE